MTLATVQETVTVTGEAPVVEVSKTEVAAVITQEQLEMLPVANRALVTLSLLLPGTSQDGTRPRRNNAQVGAGTLQFTTLALADGTLNMSTKAGEPRQDFPQAAVREVRVITSSAPAEFGGRAGGVVSVVTRGGTNAFSGEAYEYFRNNAMQRLDALTKADLDARGLPEFDTSRHQFGGALGGPIIRDRMHFFVAAEQTSEDEPYRVAERPSGVLRQVRRACSPTRGAIDCSSSAATCRSTDRRTHSRGGPIRGTGIRARAAAVPHTRGATPTFHARRWWPAIRG